jgi:hypothetical protein
MNNNNRETIEALDKKEMRLRLASVLLVIPAGLSLAKKFRDVDLFDQYLPFLASENVVNSILIVSIVFTLWTGYQIMVISRQKRELSDTQSS